MKRDMELCRKILFAIDDEYVDTAIYDLKIDGYSMEQVVYHCKILHDADLISDYGAQFADNHIWAFGVGALTWEGHEYGFTLIRTKVVSGERIAQWQNSYRRTIMGASVTDCPVMPN